MKLTFKDLLSAFRTKSSLTATLAEGLLKHYSSNSIFKLVIVYGNKIKGHDFEEKHAHEQADTIIRNHVLASLADSPWRDI